MPLQRMAAELCPYTPSADAEILHFATMEEKNIYDERRELERAAKLHRERFNAIASI